VPARALRLIADGAVDGYIRRWAHEAVRSGRPLLLRPGHEATNPAYAWGPSAGNTASDYRRFWQHVRQIFRDEGARNVSFVWTPFSAQDREWFPGLEAVDWIGFDIFNFGGLAQEGIWFDFHSLTKPFYDAYAPLGLPLMITEVGSSSVGGNKADWLREMFHDVAHGSFPALRALVLFDQPSGHTVGGLPVDWSVGEVASALDGVRAEASGPGRFESRAAR
jgi:beta-mannanase